MPSSSPLQRVLDTGIVAILRAPSGDQLVQVGRSLLAGGIDVIEVTFTVPGAVDIISQLQRELGRDALIGAGTVLDAETARAALLAGAEYIVTPVVRPEVIGMCRRYGKLCLCGAFTPTEILTAWEAGADIVKVFPAEVGGPSYLKAIHGPLPQVRLLPTGGVTLDTLADFMKAGACAVGLGTALVERDALARGDFARIQSMAEAFVAKLRDCRS